MGTHCWRINSLKWKIMGSWSNILQIASRDNIRGLKQLIVTWRTVPRSASTEISTLTPNLATWETGFEGMVSGNMLSGNYWLVVSSVSWQREVHSPVPCDQFDTWKLQNVTDPFTILHWWFQILNLLGMMIAKRLSEFFEWASWFLSNISCLQITIFGFKIPL